MSNVTRAVLVTAGYRPEQIISCPLNDARENCPCEKFGPQADCVFGRRYTGNPDVLPISSTEGEAK
jgi:hypothetical protein